MKKTENKITEDTTLAEILKCPKAEDILSKYNLPCLHCPIAAYEMNKIKIKEIAKRYSIDLKNLLRDLNKNMEMKK